MKWDEKLPRPILPTPGLHSPRQDLISHHLPRGRANRCGRESQVRESCQIWPLTINPFLFLEAIRSVRIKLTYFVRMCDRDDDVSWWNDSASNDGRYFVVGKAEVYSARKLSWNRVGRQCGCGSVGVIWKAHRGLYRQHSSYVFVMKGIQNKKIDSPSCGWWCDNNHAGTWPHVCSYTVYRLCLCNIPREFNCCKQLLVCHYQESCYAQRLGLNQFFNQLDRKFTTLIINSILQSIIKVKTQTFAGWMSNFLRIKDIKVFLQS